MTDDTLPKGRKNDYVRDQLCRRHFRMGYTICPCQRCPNCGYLFDFREEEAMYFHVSGECL